MILNADVAHTKSAGKAIDKLPNRLLPNGALWPYMTNLLLNFDPLQVRYAGHAFTNIYQTVAMAAEQTGDTAAAIQVLHTVILRLDPASSTLTPAHYVFIRLCIRSRAFAEAANILNRPIVSLPFDTDKATQSRSYKYFCSFQESGATYLTTTTGLNVKWIYRQYLEYFLMGSLAYLALRQYHKALFYLEVVLTAPTSGPNVTSMLQVEAYKKWVLVSLLVKGGRSTSPPRAIPNGTLKSIRALAKPYDCLVDAFKTNNMSFLRAEIDAGQRFWQDDCNMGLVVEVFHAFRKFQVQRLGNTFAALPIVEVAARTSPDPTDISETTAYVTSLIAAGELNATMAASPPSQATLRFSPAGSNKSELQIRQSLAYQTSEMRDLLAAISNNEHRLEISKEYVDMLKKLKKAKEQGGEKGGEQIMFADVTDLDEDMMGDE
jgi:COP9 signalosome complex subunit 3